MTTKLTKKMLEEEFRRGVNQGVEYGIKVARVLLPEDHRCPDVSCIHCKEEACHVCPVCYTMWDADVELCPDDSCPNSNAYKLREAKLSK